MKKFIFALISAVFVFSTFASGLPTAAAEEETYTYVDFAGMLIEIGNTSVPTTLIIRENSTGVDYTVNITSLTILGQKRDQYTRLEDWIPGDQIRIRGNQNDNTGVVDANVAANLSLVTTTYKGLNGWITEIKPESNLVKVQWMGLIYDVTVDSTTHVVVAGKNPASIYDLKVGDRVRGRVLKNLIDGKLKSKILIVLRRGDDLYMTVRTWAGNVELLSMASETTPTTSVLNSS